MERRSIVYWLDQWWISRFGENECVTLNSRQMLNVWWCFYKNLEFGVYRILELKSSSVLTALCVNYEFYQKQVSQM